MNEDFKRWLESQYEPKTQLAYAAAVDQFCGWMQARDDVAPQVAEITKLDIAHYRRSLQDRGLSPSTINKSLAGIRAWMIWAMALDLRSDNPTLGLKRIEDGRATIAPRGLEPNEEGRLLRAAGKTRHPLRDTTIVTLLLQTGLRISELVATNWNDLIISERSGSLTVRQGKGNKHRLVPLSLTARQTLWDWAVATAELAAPNARRWSQAHAELLMAWIATMPGAPLFSSQKKGRLSVRAIQAMIGDVARIAAIVDVSPHTLRHTCAFHLLKAGATLVEVAQILGHSSVSTTQIYTGSTEKHLQAAIERIGWE